MGWNATTDEFAEQRLVNMVHYAVGCLRRCCSWSWCLTTAQAVALADI